MNERTVSPRSQWACKVPTPYRELVPMRYYVLAGVPCLGKSATAGTTNKKNQIFFVHLVGTKFLQAPCSLCTLLRDGEYQRPLQSEVAF